MSCGLLVLMFQNLTRGNSCGEKTNFLGAEKMPPIWRRIFRLRILLHTVVRTSKIQVNIDIIGENCAYQAHASEFVGGQILNELIWMVNLEVDKLQNKKER